MGLMSSTVSDRISTAEDLFAAIKSFDINALRYEITKLEKIREWALTQIGVDYEVGDRVVIAEPYTVKQRLSDGHPNGWWPYRECLVAGVKATVHAIDFNGVLGYWYADIVLDREWSVHEDGDRVTRYWNGPVADTPEGMTPPSPYNQEHYPEGRRHRWSFEAALLRKIEGET